jgi:cell division septum initiation protein DivIVA
MMKFTKEQIMRATETLEGAKVMVANRDFDEFQNAIITAINALTIVKELTEENERLKRDVEILEDVLDTSSKVLVQSTKADTVRKMQHRLTSNEFYIVADNYDGMQYVDFCAWVEDVAKEVLEENNV